MTDILRQYEAARKQTVIADFSLRGKIEVRGSERIDFLHRILTNDIKNLKPGSSCYAALLNAAGKTLAWMQVFIFPDFVLLDTVPDFGGKLLELLDKYLITEDVLLTDATGNYTHLVLYGAQAETKIATFQNLTPTKDSLHKDKYHLLALQDNKIEIIKSMNLLSVGPETLECLRIENGELIYGIDMDESISFPETGLDDVAASETKGCYPGQEVVARTKTYKGLRKKMVGFILEKGKLPAAGDKIYPLLNPPPKIGGGEGGGEIGWITSACYSPGLDKGIALGYVAKGFFEEPKEVGIKISSGLIAAKTTGLPFVQS